MAIETEHEVQEQSLNRWGVFAILMIVLAPIVGSVTTAIGIVAGLVAGVSWARHSAEFVSFGPVTTVFRIFLAYAATLIFAGIANNGDIDFYKDIAIFSAFFYFLPVLKVLPNRSKGLTPRRIGEAATFALCAIAVMTLGSFVVVGNIRVQLFAGNEAVLGGILLFLTFFTLLGFEKRSRLSRAVAIIAFLFGLLIIAAAVESRSATVASAILLPAAAIFLARHFGVSLKKMGLIAVFAVAVSGGYFALFPPKPSYDTVIGRYALALEVVLSGETLADRYSSTGERLLMWRGGIRAFLASPVYGYGPDHRYTGSIPFQEEGLARHPSHLHSIYVTHAVAGGTLTLIALFAILVSPFYLLWRYPIRAETQRDLMYMGSVLGLGVPSLGLFETLFFHDLYTSFLMFNLVVFATLVSLNLSDDPVAQPDRATAS